MSVTTITNAYPNGKNAVFEAKDKVWIVGEAALIDKAFK